MQAKPVISRSIDVASTIDHISPPGVPQNAAFNQAVAVRGSGAVTPNDRPDGD
jgi:hypothetical protein